MCTPHEVILQTKKIIMATRPTLNKVELLNPNTRRSMNIDQHIYDIFSKAIYHSLKSGKQLTFTQMVEGVDDCFKKQNIQFEGSLEWYCISIKNDMHSRGVLEVFSEKGRKLHRLKK